MSAVLRRFFDWMERADFPSYVPPLLVKELRQGLRSPGFVLFACFLPVLMALPFLFRGFSDGRFVGRAVVDAVFWLGVVGVFLLLCPLRALWGVSGEKGTGTGDLLVLTRMSPYRIVLEKWISLMMQGLLLASLLLPFYFFRYFMGGVELGRDIVGMVIILIWSCSLSAIGLWVSGTPLLYKILFGFVVLMMTVSTLAMTSVAGMGQSGLEGLVIPGNIAFMSLFLLAALFLGWLFSKGCLHIAARWLAPPSENVSLELRKTSLQVMLLLVVFSSLAWLTGDRTSVSHHVLACVAMVFVQIITSFCVLEMVWPARRLPVHLKKLEESGTWIRRTMGLFLPGWQSAALFYSVLTLLCLVLVTGIAMVGGTPELIGKTVKLYCLSWAASLFLPVVFQSVFRRSGIYSLLFYYLFLGLVLAVGSVVVLILYFSVGKQFAFSMAGFLPIVNATVLQWQDAMVKMPAGSLPALTYDEFLFNLGCWCNIALMLVVLGVVCLSLGKWIRNTKKELKPRDAEEKNGKLSAGCGDI